MNGWMDGWMDRWMDRWMDGRKEGREGGRDGWMDGWMDEWCFRPHSELLRLYWAGTTWANEIYGPDRKKGFEWIVRDRLVKL